MDEAEISALARALAAAEAAFYADLTRDLAPDLLIVRKDGEGWHAVFTVGDPVPPGSTQVLTGRAAWRAYENPRGLSGVAVRVLEQLSGR